MKKRLKLRGWVKELLLILLLLVIAVVSCEIYIDRMEQIENGNMILIDQNAGDR